MALIKSWGFEKDLGHFVFALVSHIPLSGSYFLYSPQQIFLVRMVMTWP